MASTDTSDVVAFAAAVTVYNVLGLGSHNPQFGEMMPGWTSRRIPQLAWNLEWVAAELVVDPGLMEVANPRLHVEPVDGLPLLRLTRPTFMGMYSALLLVLLTPLLLVLAVGVKLDGDPVLFRQTRVGRHGRGFTMVKFRSISMDAGSPSSWPPTRDPGPCSRRRATPASPGSERSCGAPRSTSCRSSSTSSPVRCRSSARPPLRRSRRTASTSSASCWSARGLTGLWQISGRSDLSWEQSLRLDLRYAENGNLALDALLLAGRSERSSTAAALTNQEYDVEGSHEVIHNARNMPARRVLVTGGSGFVGHHVAARLVGQGDEVHATSRGESTALTSGFGSINWHRLDVSDASAVTELVNRIRPDVIFHLASAAVGSRDPALVVPIMRTNLGGAVNLMAAALETGVSRVVLAGSMEEPGVDGTQSVPNSPYSAAKGAATTYARMFFELWGLPVTVLRIAMAYGPGQGDGRKLVPHAISAFMEGRSPELSSGSRLVDWVYVEDLVDAVLRAATSERGVGEAIQIGSGTAVSIEDTVLAIRSLTGASQLPHFGAIEDRPMERSWVADTRAARELLGWRAKTSLVDGLSRTVDWYYDQARAATPA